MTNTQLRVDGPQISLVTEVVASLPMSFIHDPVDPAVVVIDGATGWPSRIQDAADRGAQGIIVIDPDVDDPDDIDRVAQAVDVPVLISESWAGNPTIESIITRWAAQLADTSSVECALIDPTVTGNDPGFVLRQLRVLRRLGLIPGNLAEGTATDSAYTWRGTTTTGAQISLFAVRSAGTAPTLTVTLRTPTEFVDLQLHSARTARPATARRIGFADGDLHETIYQTAHRATFLRIRSLLDGSDHTNDLAAFAEDLRTTLDRG